jgi:hypothetical protein
MTQDIRKIISPLKGIHIFEYILTPEGIAETII